MNFGTALRVESMRASAARLFATLDVHEVAIVSRAVAHAERRGLWSVAKMATRLGNGGLYPILSLLFIAIGVIEAPVQFIMASALSTLLPFTIYPILKQLLARTRPCDYKPTLVRSLAPLDHYSCPSGHTMTAVAYGVSLAIVLPEAVPLSIAISLLIGWSRVALGHHYVTDVLLGAILGGGVALFVTALIL